jgi:hypothetical protein
MTTTDVFGREILWNRLREPARSPQISQDTLLLLTALDSGWQIEGPAQLVHVGERFVDCAYLFNLQNRQHVANIQLAIPVTPDLDDFLCQEGIDVYVHDPIPCCTQAMGRY